MSRCNVPYATGNGTFPPMKRCAARGKYPGAACPEHILQMNLFDRDPKLKGRYMELVGAFEAWEDAVKQSKGHSEDGPKVAAAARHLVAVARGKP